MKKLNMIMALVVLFSLSDSYADINSLFKGVVVNDSTLNELSTTTTPDAFSYGISWLSQESVGGGTVDAFLKAPNSTDLYSLSSKLKLYHTNFDTRTLLGHWPLTRWPHQHIIPEVKQRYEDNYWDYRQEEYSTGHSRAIGCFQNTPLRYGGIDNDNQKELVLFLGSDFVVFSPQYKKIVFAETLGIYDWLTLEETALEIAYETPRDEITVQYLSSIIGFNTDKSEAGYRGYSKLYFGDFNDNGTADILVWRKLYKSRQINDPVKGFIKLNDTWQHFEKEAGETATGEYIPQATEQADIKAWLDSKQLIWQKGYPSQSECAGQENQLIPEMHDSLLNDADVLK